MNSLAQINDTNLKIFDEICAERISAINLDVFIAYFPPFY